MLGGRLHTHSRVSPEIPTFLHQPRCGSGNDHSAPNRWHLSAETWNLNLTTQICLHGEILKQAIWVVFLTSSRPLAMAG